MNDIAINCLNGSTRRADWVACASGQSLGTGALEECISCVRLNQDKGEKPVFYVAHPVSGDVKTNIENVIQWIRWLTLNDPSRVYIAPWVAEVQAFMGDVVEPGFYDRVLRDDVTVVRKLDGILMVGGTISRGMGIERDGMREGMTLQDWSYARTPADLKQEHIDALGAQ